MRFNHFDLNLLVVLDALLSEKSITKAGEKVFLSQSGTSGALARLREYFDDPILTQIGREMHLTPLGESLIIPVRESLLKIKNTLECRPNIDISQSERHIPIMMSDGPNIVIFSKVVQLASKVARKITFETIPISSDPAAQLDHGDIEFSLLPKQFLSNEHPSMELFEENFVVICWDQNEKIEKSITKELYKELGHVTVRFGSKSNEGLDTWVTNISGVERNIELIVNTFNAIPSFIVGTERIATVHYRLAQLWQTQFPIKILQEPFNIPSFTWCLQWHQIKESDPVNVWFRTLMQDVANDITSELTFQNPRKK